MIEGAARRFVRPQVRNYILSKWRSNVRRWLSRQEAGERILSRHQRLVDAAYRFLTSQGYINFGVAPPMLERAAAEPKRQETVVVIGAGLAGIAAAHQLKMNGFKVVLLEGRNRPGALTAVFIAAVLSAVMDFDCHARSTRFSQQVEIGAFAIIAFC